MRPTFIFLIAAFFASACANSIDGSNEAKASLPEATLPLTPLVDTSKKDTLLQPTIAAPAAPAATTVALNPAHGQAGHRCDIAVGAPLNASVQTVAPNQSIQNSAAIRPMLQPGTTNAKPGARLNPAHGQPGHDCTIEVGKPLKQ